MKNILLTSPVETSLCRKLKLRVTFPIYMTEQRVVYRVPSDSSPLSIHIPAHPFVNALCAAVRPCRSISKPPHGSPRFSRHSFFHCCFLEARTRPGHGPDGARYGARTGPGGKIQGFSESVNNKYKYINIIIIFNVFLKFLFLIEFFHRAPSGPRTGPRPVPDRAT